jgi:phosphopantothenoylcysteine synthetase/decarboxylase
LSCKPSARNGNTANVGAVGPAANADVVVRSPATANAVHSARMGRTLAGW